MGELVFEVMQAHGGYCAECLTENIVTQGDSWDELRNNVVEAFRSIIRFAWARSPRCYESLLSTKASRGTRLLRRRNDLAMRKMSKASLTADQIAEKASRGEDVSAHFTNRFTVMKSAKKPPERAAAAKIGGPTRREAK